MARVYDDTVPEVDASPGDDDAAIAKWARAHRKRMGLRFLSAAGIALLIAFITWRRTAADGNDALVIWILGGVVALALALGGVWKLVTQPPQRSTRYPSW